MVAQLIMQDDGSYAYEEVDTVKKSVSPNLNEFEAYEGAKKGGEDLVGASTLAEQTEKIQREIPSRVEFDDKTGTFITKKAETVGLEYKEPERTPESTEMTALQKVMNMESMAGTGDSGLDTAYKSIERLQKMAEQKQRAETLQSYFQTAKTGLDIYNIATGKDVLMKKMLTPLKFKGSNLTSMGTGMINPYTIGAAVLMTPQGRKVAKKVVKTAKKAAKSVLDFVTGGSVICTELNRQGLISNEDYKIHWNYTIHKWDKDELKGYWIWAMPTAKKMKTNKLLTKFWHHIMKYKIQYIKYNLGKAKFTLKGYIYNLLVEQISLLISKFIPKKKIKEVLA